MEERQNLGLLLVGSTESMALIKELVLPRHMSLEYRFLSFFQKPGCVD